MSPEVTAAIIAAGGVVLTVIATVAVQISGRRATSRDTQKALEEQRKQLDRTLAEQRTRTLNERFVAAAGQLGGDKPPTVRLAGVYAMAGLADDWPENRQTCIDVLCAYLRLPYGAEPEPEASEQERLSFRADREVRHTVIRVITAHLKQGAAVSWQGSNLDFTGVVFDGGSFSGVSFSDGIVSFSRAVFPAGYVDFFEAEFSGARVHFSGAAFSGGRVDFRDAKFSGGRVSFSGARFSGGTVDLSAVFSGGQVDFFQAEFSGATVKFRRARFSGGTVRFHMATFSGGEVDFGDLGFLARVVRPGREDFHGGAEFSGGQVSFDMASFSGGRVRFSGARFSGGTVRLLSAVFSGGEVDFSRPSDWAFPPAFPWTDTPPPGVKLPGRTEDSESGPSGHGPSGP